MLDFIRDIFIDGDWVDRLLGALTMGAVILLMVLLSWGVFRLADSVGVERQSSISTLIQRSHTEAYITTTYHMVGKVMVPSTIHHPESWDFLLKLPDGRCDWIGVTEETFNSHCVGDSMNVFFKDGRLSDNIYIVDFNNER